MTHKHEGTNQEEKMPQEPKASVWTKDLTVCSSCASSTYPMPVEWYGYPLLNDGTTSPDPWPLCDMHAIPYALVAGWKPVKIKEQSK